MTTKDTLESVFYDLEEVEKTLKGITNRVDYALEGLSEELKQERKTGYDEGYDEGAESEKEPNR